MTRDEIIAKLIQEYRWSEGAIEFAVRTGCRCEYCGRDFLATYNDYDSWESDHVIPRSQGGRETAADNLASVCRTCNKLKRATTTPTLLEPALSLPERVEEARRLVLEKKEQKERELGRVRELLRELIAQQSNGL